MYCVVRPLRSQCPLLKPGEWSEWVKLDFEFGMPWFLPNEHASGLCRFYLQEVHPNFKLFVTPMRNGRKLRERKISTKPFHFMPMTRLFCRQIKRPSRQRTGSEVSGKG